jgi:hypothetical protein
MMSRDHDFHKVSYQLCLGIAKELFDSRISCRDAAISSSYNNRIRRSEEQLLKQRLRMLGNISAAHACTH